jgi:hypothetical protein
MQSYLVKLPTAFKQSEDIESVYGRVFKQRAGACDPQSPITVRGDVYYSIDSRGLDRQYYMMVQMSNLCAEKIRSEGLMNSHDAIYGTHGYNNLIKDPNYTVCIYRRGPGGRDTTNYVSEHMLSGEESCAIL